jgi:hypothetical protein
MTGIYIFGSLFIPLRRHFRRVALSRHSTRSQFFTLNVVFRKVGFSAVNGFCRHVVFLIASVRTAEKASRSDTRKASGREPKAFSNKGYIRPLMLASTINSADKLTFLKGTNEFSHAFLLRTGGIHGGQQTHRRQGTQEGRPIYGRQKERQEVQGRATGKIMVKLKEVGKTKEKPTHARRTVWPPSPSLSI